MSTLLLSGILHQTPRCRLFSSTATRHQFYSDQIANFTRYTTTSVFAVSSSLSCSAHDEIIKRYKQGRNKMANKANKVWRKTNKRGRRGRPQTGQSALLEERPSKRKGKGERKERRGCKEATSGQERVSRKDTMSILDVTTRCYILRASHRPCNSITIPPHCALRDLQLMAVGIA